MIDILIIGLTAKFMHLRNMVDGVEVASIFLILSFEFLICLFRFDILGFVIRVCESCYSAHIHTFLPYLTLSFFSFSHITVSKLGCLKKVFY